MLEAELASRRKANTSADACSKCLDVGGCSKLDSLQDIAAGIVKVAVALSSWNALYIIPIGRPEGWGEVSFNEILGTMQHRSPLAPDGFEAFSMRFMQHT